MSRVVVVGLGLMGGSLARALVRAGGEVGGWSPDPDERSAARGLGIATSESLDELLAGAHGVVLATPLGAMRSLLERVSRESPAWIQDVASLQAPVLDWAAAAGVEERYVSAHPMVGGEGSGFSASAADLYRGAPIWLSARDPDAELSREAEAFWSGLGARPAWIDPEAHDQRMARASHLPQVVATHLAAAMARGGLTPGDLGPGGRDTTRLAGSDPVMWRDILASGARPLAAALREVAVGLEEEADRLEGGDARSFGDLLAFTRRWRGR